MVKYCCSVELSFVLATSLAYTGTDTHTDTSCCFLFCLIFTAGMSLYYS